MIINPLPSFFNGKNANNKVNRWSLELATYSITYKWISGAKNNCLSWLVELLPTTPATVNMLTVMYTDRPAYNTRSCTIKDSAGTAFTPHPDVTPDVSPDMNQTPKSLMAGKLEALLQMQRTDPFCKCISKHLFNGKALQHETDIFNHVKGLLYKHITDSGHKFLALVIPKSWKYTVLLQAHGKLGHQGNSYTYCLVKRQYYWKCMEKDIRNYIANCTLCCREKAKIQHYPLQMTEIPDRPFDKIAIDLITEWDTSTSGNKHVLTIIDHLMGWSKTFPIPDKTTDTIVSTVINEYLPVHMCPQYILSYNGMEFTNSLMDQVLWQLGIDRIFSVPYHPPSNSRLDIFYKYLKQH